MKHEIINGVDSVNNYPYGRMQCTRTIEVQYKKGFGYRISTQTINPKTGRTNAPKNSTYYPYIILHKDPETGHAKGLHFDFNSPEQIQRFIEFLQDNKEDLIFTDEQSQDIWSSIISSIRVTAEWAKMKIAPEGKPLSAVEFLEACKTKEMIQAYGKHVCITDLCTMGLDIPATLALYEDKENGQALKEYRITSR